MATCDDAPGHGARQQPGVPPRLVASDLDGTIVRVDGTLSARTVAAFGRVEQAGARFVLVTGRPPRAMTAIAGAFGRRGVAICSNGALAYDMSTGGVTPVRLIAPEQLALAVRRLRAAVPGIQIAVEYPDGRALDHLYEPVLIDVDDPGPRFDDPVLTARPAAKLLGRHLAYTCDDLLAIVSPALDGLVTVTHSSASGLIEAAAIGVNKATAVAAVAMAHKISPAEVIAFGDQPNDLPLLAWAGVSCAVANAHPDVLAAATRVIPANDDDGVAATLEALFPAGEPAPRWASRSGRTARS
jgi:HAD superfamily hydrolase (TIGR01484 family)